MEWIYNTDNTLKCVDRVLNHFDHVVIADFWDSNFKLKIKKNESQNYSIGFIFGMIEDQKVDCCLAEYSISQTSLEQIFNNFASQSDQEVLQENTNKEIKVNREFISTYLNSIK